MIRIKYYHILFFLATISLNSQKIADSLKGFKINDLEYLEMRGANVMLAHDFYPESHQGGVGIIQNGIRVATNGDLRLEPAPGQWQPVPKVGVRRVDLKNQVIQVRMSYPDPSKNGKGFNPIAYPDLQLAYDLKVKANGKSFILSIDLEEPIPKEWEGKIGLNLEFFPGILFGKTYYMDTDFGLFSRQANGPGYYTKDGEYRLESLAKGQKLVIAPDFPAQTLEINNRVPESKLELLDGRAIHSNGWFIVRSLVPSGKTKNAVEWEITPNVLDGFTYDPVIQHSQVGYHPNQDKIAIIETDPNAMEVAFAELYRINPLGEHIEVLTKEPKVWGNFLRYKYLQFDFSEIRDSGLYVLKYGKSLSQPFQINKNVYKRGVWQPTLEYFLPVQMCHMRVNDRYKVWHGLCHIDDARMAPVALNHFDGYLQGSSTLTAFKPGEHVPQLNQGGWHDAGDFDLRVESQASTVQGLAHIYEIFDLNYDNTSVDQKSRIVEILKPDGKPDVLQQIEHGVLSIIGGYSALGRFYRGIIVPTKRQYTLLGDPVNHSDNTIFSNSLADQNIPVGLAGAPDDRWVFTEENPARELSTAAALAAAARVLKNYNPDLAAQCLSIAKGIWTSNDQEAFIPKLELAVELLRTTQNTEYATYLSNNTEGILADIENTGWIVGQALPLITEPFFKKQLHTAVIGYFQKVVELGKKTPYGLPYEPNIWGAGWGIQNFGMKQYYFYRSYPKIFPKDYLLSALNFILGVHPGVNTSSFASGVGVRSLTQAYGINRGEFSYIPGGVGSGTALIRPDFPELLEWPFLWQQTEYVLGGGTTDYMFLVLAADQILNDLP